MDLKGGIRDYCHNKKVRKQDGNHVLGYVNDEVKTGTCWQLRNFKDTNLDLKL